MGRIGSALLDTNDRFPELDLRLISDKTIKLPQEAGDGYAVVFFYRGGWWPICRQQLADFQSAIGELGAEQISLFAASADPIEKAKETAEKLKITYPLAYGLNAEEVSEITGSYYEKEKKFLQPTNFLIRPDKTIEVASYSSGPISRFVAKGVIMLVKHYKSKK